MDTSHPSDSPDVVGPTFSEQDCVVFVEPDQRRGGQYVGTRNDVSVRHVPTGICIRVDSERSQFQNKLRAMEELSALVELREERERLRGALEEITERSSYSIDPVDAFEDALSRARKALSSPSSLPREGANG